jgi:hypothetical protein
MPIVEGLKFGDLATNVPIPEAVYHVRIAKTEIRTAEPSEREPDPYPYVSVAYSVMGQSPEEYHGRQIFENATLAPSKNFSIRQIIVAVFGGADQVDPDLDVVEYIRNGGLVDQELLIAVGIEKAREFKGKKYEARNNVTKRMPVTA